MLRFSSVEESRIVYKASPPGEQYCLQVIKDPAEPTVSGMRVKLARSNSNLNSLQLWSLSPDDRILLSSDPNFCLHVTLDHSHPDTATLSTAKGVAYNGAQLCVSRVEKHYKKQAQQLWLQGPDERIRLASHRQYCIMLWHPVPHAGQRVDLWKAGTYDLTAQQFIISSEEAPYLPLTDSENPSGATSPSNTSNAAQQQSRPATSAAGAGAAAVDESKTGPVGNALALSRAPTSAAAAAVAAANNNNNSSSSASASMVAAAAATSGVLSHERVGQILDVLDSDLASGAITHAQHLNISAKLESGDAAEQKAALALLSFYHRADDGDDARARDDALAVASGARRAADGAIASALRQLDGCLVRAQVTKQQYDTFRASLTLGDAEERETVSRAIAAMVPNMSSEANWATLPVRLWVRVCGFLTFTEAALLALVSTRVGEACNVHEIWYNKCLEFFATKPAWSLPAEHACADWKRYLHTYFTKWVPLELEKQKGQRMFHLRVAVRFKPLPEEEQAEKAQFTTDGSAASAGSSNSNARGRFGHGAAGHGIGAANGGGVNGTNNDDEDAPEGYEIITPGAASSGPQSTTSGAGRVSFGATTTAPSGGGPATASGSPRSGSPGRGRGSMTSSFASLSLSAAQQARPRGGAGGGSGSPSRRSTSPRKQQQQQQRGGAGGAAGGDNDEGDDARSWVEMHQGKCEIVEVSELTASVRATVDDRPRHFQFHDVFAGTTTQKDLYARLVWRMTRDVLFGYSATVFVYGQTASGKTWTMFGPSLIHPVTGQLTPADRSLWGVVPRACEQILHTLNHEHGTSYTFEVSYVEIYQDRIHDLLNGGARLQLIEDMANDRDFRLDNPALLRASSMKDVDHILATGERQKTVFATQMNERSSRSHCLFTITLTQTNVERNFRERNKFNLVDLAGSERQKKSLTHGKRFEEAKNINKSLATLERCILCLSNPSTTHIPYRDSELTKMLQQALGGYANCKRTLLVTCSRDHAQVLETLSTLRFAYRARHIQQGKKKSHI